ncbi:DUF4129 domain-containing protein [Neobacillus sp. YIM B06451]|uniref:DUF4129 domain-containing protein n=1 Tax=Neobacillus sp. YIM B06451 TaxID=3070994 RepID=UPI00292FF307|nr:DUF4129 domain-containing protein [Neobacillus sp. YIM B06451]
MIRKVYLFLIELLFGVLLVFPYLWPNDRLWYVFPALFVLVIFFTVYLLLLGRWGEKAKMLFLIFFLPALLLIGMFTGFHPFSVISAGAFLFWRGNSLEGGREEDHDLWVASFWGLAVVPGLIFSHFKNESLFHMTIILVILQFMGVLLGRLLLNLYNFKGNFREKAGFVTFLSKKVTLLVLFSISIALALDYFKLVFFFVLQGIVWVYGIITAPILFLAFKIVSLLFDSNRMPKETEFMKWQQQLQRFDNEGTYYFTGIFLMVLTGLALLVIFIYLYYKGNRIVLDGKTSNAIEQSLVAHLGGRIVKRRKPAAPNNPLRREVFNLEYFAFKNGFGRFEAETIGEWLSRIGMPSDKRLIGVYEDVRYGDIKIDPSELEFARHQLKGIREQIKQKRKEQKKKPKG